MSSVITSILSSTIGLLCNKARDKLANKLREGDVTDGKLREIIVGEFDDIKAKLDGLSRKDLLASYRFLKEGVDLLVAAIDDSNERTAVNEARSRHSGMSSNVEPSILTEALQLSIAVEKLEIASNKTFAPAKERFKYARIRATDAFCNEALSIQDRIFASKLRVVSEILEYLENPETAIIGCLSFLQELHSLPGLREMFCVYLGGGVKSKLNKAERNESIKSVMFINYVLFQFNLKFSRKLQNRVIWPGSSIDLNDRSFNPIFHWPEVWRKSWGVEIMRVPNEVIFQDARIYPDMSAVNSYGEFVALGSDDNVKVILNSGKSNSVEIPFSEDGIVIKQRVSGLAVDHNDFVYVVKWLKTRKKHIDSQSYVLYVLDEHYNVKRESTLDFLFAIYTHLVKIVVSKTNDIVLIKREDPHIYVCDETGRLKSKFERKSHWLRSLSISDKNEIIIPSDDCKAVHIYAENGGLRSIIQLPEGHRVIGVVFHYAICKIVILTRKEDWKEDTCFLHCCSKTGELELPILFSENVKQSYITSHPCGLASVVRKYIATFI